LELPEILLPDPIQVSCEPPAMYEMILQEKREALAALEDDGPLLFDNDVTAYDLTACPGIPPEGPPDRVAGAVGDALEAQEFFGQQMEELHCMERRS
jgi:hypothetical protein